MLGIRGLSVASSVVRRAPLAMRACAPALASSHGADLINTTLSSRPVARCMCSSSSGDSGSSSWNPEKLVHGAPAKPSEDALAVEAAAAAAAASARTHDPGVRRRPRTPLRPCRPTLLASSQQVTRPTCCSSRCMCAELSEVSVSKS